MYQKGQKAKEHLVLGKPRPSGKHTEEEAKTEKNEEEIFDKHQKV